MRVTHIRDAGRESSSLPSHRSSIFSTISVLRSETATNLPREARDNQTEACFQVRQWLCLINNVTCSYANSVGQMLYVLVFHYGVLRVACWTLKDGEAMRRCSIESPWMNLFILSANIGYTTGQILKTMHLFHRSMSMQFNTRGFISKHLSYCLLTGRFSPPSPSRVAYMPHALHYAHSQE